MAKKITELKITDRSVGWEHEGGGTYIAISHVAAVEVSDLGYRNANDGSGEFVCAASIVTTAKVYEIEAAYFDAVNKLMDIVMGPSSSKKEVSTSENTQ